MAQSILFMSEDANQVINNLSGSGLGFYGAGGYNMPVIVGQYPDNTYITDAYGTASNAVKVNNVKYISAASGQIPGGEIRPLTSIPNYLATLQVRLQSDVPVRCQNAQLMIYDRNDITQPAVGVLTQVALIVHTAITALPAGSGSTTWSQIGGSGAIFSVNSYPAAISPGSGGFSPSGANTVDTIHDWFWAISPTPTSVGSKTNFGLYFSTEFL